MPDQNNDSPVPVCEAVPVAVEDEAVVKDTTEFRKELESLINRHSMENGSDTPDFILAEYLTDQLKLFDKVIGERERWYGRDRPVQFS